MKKLLVVTSLLFSAQTGLADTKSALSEAAIAGQTEILKTLIQDGADVPAEGGTAMISAAFSALQNHESSEPNDGQIEAIRILVDAGADVNEHFDNGVSTLMLMAILRQADIVLALIEAGADLNASNNADGGTPLIFAVYGGSTEIVSHLITAGADLNMTDAGTGKGDGRTALSYAIEKAHAEITEVLTQAGAK